jgi:rhodanese-related sulfurtransferase
MTKIQTMLLRLGSFGIAAGIAWFAWQRSADEAQRTHQFGPIPLNAKLTHELIIRNPTASVLPLHSATPSCTCLQLNEPLPTHISAQGQITIPVTFIPEKLGSVRTSLKLDCPGLPQEEWHYIAEVIPPPEALPTAATLKAVQLRLQQQIVIPAAAGVTMPADQRVIVDVRSSIDFQTSTIIGAINVPLAQLETLPASLRNRRALILDRGYGADATAQVVINLRGKGWKDLQIIEGGLSAWSAHGGRITSAESPDAWRLTSAEARTHATRPGWIIVAPESMAQSLHLSELFPEVLTFPATTPEAAAQLASTLQSRRPGAGACTSMLHVLIATEGGESSTSFAQAMRAKLSGSPVFILEDGLRGYLDHLRHLRPNEPGQWTTMAHFAGALADLRTRQRRVTSCSSCPR